MDKREEIGKALGKIPSGVGVLTVQNGGTASAMLASWFQQVAFEPPMIAISVNRKRPILEIIQQAKKFAVNLFHTNQKDLFSHFAKGFEPGQDPFQGIKIDRKVTGSAILSDAMAYLECEITGELEAGDHKVFLGKIIDGGILQDGHSMVHTRKNGFHY